MGNNGTPEFIQGKLGAGAPPYALVGFQYADSFQEEVAGKKPTQGPPFSILSADPGVNQIDDKMWQLTFGASHDSFLTIINGKFIKSLEEDITVYGIYQHGTVNTISDNLWRSAGDTQQIQFIATGETAASGAALAKTDNGDIDKLRGIGLRIPQMAGGYGRTIDGLPTDPNSQQPGGRANDPEHKTDRGTWKYGPVEMRWDYRKGVWSAYNEQITDHYNQNLGTWVFGTNPDFAGGFPFLRGKLEDVFWVRQPESLAGSDGSSPGVKTGEVFTHLDHRWFDKDEEGAAPLSSIFIIPHKNSTDPDCHPKGSEHTLGPELTGECDRIDIKTGVHFFKSQGIDGPISFGGRASNVDVCCEPRNKKYHLGTILFQDSIGVQCDDGQPHDVQVGGSGPTSECHWVPAIAIDECSLVGGHLNDLVHNDAELASLHASLCAIIAVYTQQLRGFLNINFSNIAIDMDYIQDEVEAALKALALCISSEMYSFWESLADFRLEVLDGISKLVDDINDALAICCNNEINPIPQVDLPSAGRHDSPDPCRVDYDKIITFITDFPEIPCDSCPPITLWVPCSDDGQINVTGGCDPKISSIPDISDECQANEKLTGPNTINSGETGRLSGDAGPRFGEVPEPQVIFAGAGFIGVQEGA